MTKAQALRQVRPGSAGRRQAGQDGPVSFRPPSRGRAAESTSPVEDNLEDLVEV